MANVRVRGIYTTAVTHLLLDAGHAVVQASEPIRERFDADFGDATHEVTVATTSDRQ
ncbi:RNA-binding protein, partial [Haloferax sp. Atlit-6N]